MMRAYDGGHQGIEADTLENLGAHQRVRLYSFEFLRSELARLGNDSFRQGEFANVVQQGGGAQTFQLAVVHTHFPR